MDYRYTCRYFNCSSIVRFFLRYLYSWSDVSLSHISLISSYHMAVSNHQLGVVDTLYLFSNPSFWTLITDLRLYELKKPRLEAKSKMNIRYNCGMPWTGAHVLVPLMGNLLGVFHRNKHMRHLR